MEETPNQNINAPADGQTLYSAYTPPPPPTLAYPSDQLILPTWLKIMLIGGLLIFFLSSILGSFYTLSYIGESYNYDYEDRIYWSIILSIISQIGIFMMAFACFFITFILKDMDIRVRKGCLMAFTLFMLLLAYSSWASLLSMY
ncbi:MAG: hypothetical protein KAS16_08935 [Thermoplasmata archaeon]|nr:hypothetical protein [Thermoplasmata archaeon]